MDVVNVGIVAVGDDPRDWAIRAHVPALQSLPERFDIGAVVGRQEQIVRPIAESIGARRYFTDADALLACPEIDLILIAVKTPRHLPIADASLRAGKNVYCEWPLAANPGEVSRVQKLLAECPASVRTFVGLQTRFNPAVQKARALLQDGYVGDLLSATIHVARGRTSDGTIDDRAAYQLDDESGSGVLEVLAGHTYDTVEYLVGPMQMVSAMTAVRRREIAIAETGEVVRVTSPDHILISAQVQSGALVSVHVHDSELADPRTLIELTGTKGSLRLRSVTMGPAVDQQISICRFYLDEGRGGGVWTVVELDESAQPAAANLAAESVARMYERVHNELTTGGSDAPSFDDAFRLHRVISAIRLSAADGTRIVV